MKSEQRTALVIATGKTIEVYQSSNRGTWISKVDFKTEYTAKELKFK